MNLEIVVPCHNEEKNIKKFFIEINYVLRDKIDFNIIFVNDGSTDNTLDEIKIISTDKQKLFSKHLLVHQSHYPQR